MGALDVALNHACYFALAPARAIVTERARFIPPLRVISSALSVVVAVSGGRRGIGSILDLPVLRPLAGTVGDECGELVHERGLLRVSM